MSATCSAASADTGVTTLGADRLALQFVAVDDDNPMDAVHRRCTGGTWAEAVAEFASATGTDGCIQLQTATSARPEPINGGTSRWPPSTTGDVIGLALSPFVAAYSQEPYAVPQRRRHRNRCHLAAGG